MTYIPHEEILFTVNVHMERAQLRIYEEMWAGAEPWDAAIKEWRKRVAARLWKVRAIKRRFSHAR